MRATGREEHTGEGSWKGSRALPGPGKAELGRRGVVALPRGAAQEVLGLGEA